MEDLGTWFWTDQEYSPQKLELLVENLGSVVLSLPRIPPPPDEGIQFWSYQE